MRPFCYTVQIWTFCYAKLVHQVCTGAWEIRQRSGSIMQFGFEFVTMPNAFFMKKESIKMYIE